MGQAVLGRPGRPWATSYFCPGIRWAHAKTAKLCGWAKVPNFARIFAIGALTCLETITEIPSPLASLKPVGFQPHVLFQPAGMSLSTQLY